MEAIWSWLSLAGQLWMQNSDLIFKLFGLLTPLAALMGALSWARRFKTIFEHTAEAIDMAHYSELDRFYSDILKLAIERPYLRRPAEAAPGRDPLMSDYVAFPGDTEDSKDKAAQYDAYAYMVWNFIETIRDRLEKKSTSEEISSLQATWAPVIGAENALHRNWFLAQIRSEEMRLRRAKLDNVAYVPADKFCAEFQSFVVNHGWRNPNWEYQRKFKTSAEFRSTLKFD